MRSPVLVTFALALAGCGTNVTPGTVTKSQIAALEVAVTAEETAAKYCLDLRAGPCGDPATRLKIIADSHAAHDAVVNLRNSPRPGMLSIAQDALTRLTAEVPAASATGK